MPNPEKEIANKICISFFMNQYHIVVCIKAHELNINVWWHDATLFVYFITYIHSYNHIHTIHLSIAIR
jgi:hypothetical protein